MELRGQTFEIAGLTAEPVRDITNGVKRAHVLEEIHAAVSRTQSVSWCTETNSEGVIAKVLAWGLYEDGSFVGTMQISDIRRIRRVHGTGSEIVAEGLLYADLPKRHDSIAVMMDLVHAALTRPIPLAQGYSLLLERIPFKVACVYGEDTSDQGALSLAILDAIEADSRLLMSIENLEHDIRSVVVTAA